MPTTEPETTTQTRPRTLRADAERNRLRILAAAEEVFAAEGLDATLHDVADRAGLGVGTVYRRFRDKDAVIDALFESKINAVVDLAERAAADADAWSGLVGFLRTLCELQARDCGLQQVMHGSGHGRDRVAAARARLVPLVGALCARAQAAGRLRADAGPGDLPAVLLMVSAVARQAAAVLPGAWERYFDLLVDGLRAHPGQQVLGGPVPADEATARAMWTCAGPRRGAAQSFGPPAT